MTTQTAQPIEIEALERREPAPPPMLAPQNPMQLLTLAIDRNAPIDTIERMMALLQQYQAAEARRAFFDALAAAQGEFPPIPKTRAVEGRYKYASLDDVMAIIGPVLARHRLSISFKRAHIMDEKTGLCAAVSSALVVYHAGGHTQEFPPVMVEVERKTSNQGKALMTGAQSIGCAMTYADRYAYQGGLGARPCDEDTDANRPRDEDSYATQQQRPQRAEPTKPLNVAAFMGEIVAAGMDADHVLHAAADLGWPIKQVSELSRDQAGKVWIKLGLNDVRSHEPQRAGNQGSSPSEAGAAGDAGGAATDGPLPGVPDFTQPGWVNLYVKAVYEPKETDKWALNVYGRTRDGEELKQLKVWSVSIAERIRAGAKAKIQMDVRIKTEKEFKNIVEVYPA